MLEFITRFIQPVVRIKQEEWRKTILMFFYFACAIATLYILKPVRSSLFLTAHGAESLRYAYVGEGFFLIFITFAYIKLSRWLVHKNVLFSVVTWFFVSNILIFWFLFKLGHLEFLSYLFYIWVAAYSITIVTQCWALANDIFNPQEAKRLFGFIISGGSLGGIAGGLVTNRYAERIGTENLLLLAAGLLCLCIFFINAIWKYERLGRAHEEVKEETAQSEEAHLREKSTWKLLFSSRYLLLIAALVMIAKIASTIVDNQFNSVVEGAILEKNARTAFFGGFSALLNGVSFFMQLVLASYALRHLGIGISLLLLPVGLCFGATATIFFPVLGVAATTKIYDGSLNYSINQLSKEILYLPIPSSVRYRVKPLIDMLAYRASKTVAGFLIILITPLLGIPDEKLGLVVLLLVPLWVLAAWGVRDEYMQSIKRLLSSRKEVDRALPLTAEQAREALVHLEGERSFEKLKEFLAHKSSVTRKMSAAACLAFYSSARDVRHVKKLVEAMIRYEALEFKNVDVERAFEETSFRQDGFFDQHLLDLIKANQNPNVDLKTLLRNEEKEILVKVSETLDDPQAEINRKHNAILILATLSTQGAVDLLLNSLASIQDRSLRFNLIRALNRIRAKEERREFNSAVVKKEVMREAKSYQSILTVIEEYQQRKAVSQPEEDYLLATLQAIQEENLERIFRLLALLYDSDIIHVIYDRLIEPDPDKHVRANALELLENVLELELCRSLHPLLDDAQGADREKGNLDEIILEFLGLQDRWLAVCAIFLIVELHLEHFYSKLKGIVQCQIPIVQEAAEIALIKTGSKKIV